MLKLFFEALQYVLPALVVLGGVKIVLDHKRDERVEEIAHEARREAVRNHLDLVLSAYERCILYLNRISPQNLVMRYAEEQLSSTDLAQHLANDVREEYEHNITQQIYVSNQAWAALFQAKEQMIAIISEVANNLPNDDNSMLLRQKILESCAEQEDLKVPVAIIQMRNDVQKIFQL